MKCSLCSRPLRPGDGAMTCQECIRELAREANVDEELAVKATCDGTRCRLEDL